MTDSLKINTLSHQAVKAFCQYYIFKKCFFFLVHEAYNLDPKRKYATVYLIEESHRIASFTEIVEYYPVLTNFDCCSFDIYIGTKIIGFE